MGFLSWHIAIQAPSTSPLKVSSSTSSCLEDPSRASVSLAVSPPAPSFRTIFSKGTSLQILSHSHWLQQVGPLDRWTTKGSNAVTHFCTLCKDVSASKFIVCFLMGLEIWEHFLTHGLEQWNRSYSRILIDIKGNRKPSKSFLFSETRFGNTKPFLTNILHLQLKLQNVHA